MSGLNSDRKFGLPEKAMQGGDIFSGWFVTIFGELTRREVKPPMQPADHTTGRSGENSKHQKHPMKSYLVRVILTLCITGYGAPALFAQGNRTWIPVDPQAPPGSPVVLNVTVASQIETDIEVRVPGLWADEVEYGGQHFLRLSYPPIKFQGVGFPANQGGPGWWDFPAALKQPARNPARFVTCSGSVRKSVFPESAVGSHPQNAAEMLNLGIDPEGARPGLPRLRPMVAMSRNNTPDTLNAHILPGESQVILLPLPVAPAGFEASDAGEDGYSAPQLIDQDFYNSFNGQYVGSEPLLGEISGMGMGFAGAPLAISGIILLDPSRIQMTPIFHIYLQHLEGVEDFECALSWDSWIFTCPYLNGEALRDSLTAKGLAIEASRSARYLILCPKAWRPTLETFALWKQTKGLNVDFVYVGAGDDLPPDRDMIDAYLENYFENHYCNGVYVLICGDQDVIPSGRSSRVTGKPDFSDADSDHVYEVLGTDRFPSLYVGRLSANNAGELKNQLDKILKYERSPVSGNWPKRATLCANSQMDNEDYGVNPEWPTKYSKAVEQIVDYAGYTNQPIFQTLHAGAANNSVVRAVNQDVIDAITEGRGQLLYRGHGSTSSWASGWDGSGTGNGTSFTATSHVDRLDNRVHPIVYSIACSNSQIRQNDCIAEHWMGLANAGAVAHFGATVASYTTENHERAKGIFKAIYVSGYSRLGPMLAGAEFLSWATTGGGSSWDSNTFAYMLLGDPEMEIRRQAVPYATANGLFASVTESEGGVRIHVTDAAGAIHPGAFVNLTGSKGQRFNGFANTDGDVMIGIPSEAVARLDLMLDGYPFAVEYLQLPAMEAVGFVPTGFKVRLKNAPQGKFRVSASTNLLQWQDLGLASPQGKDQEFIDSAAPRDAGAKRFYRAVQVR